MSAKAAKGVKRQLRRLDDFLHHVTHTKHDHGDADDDEEEHEEEHDIRRRRTVSVPSPVLPSTVPSFRVIRSRSAWYLKQTSNDAEDHRPSHPRFASVEVGTQTEVEMADQGMLSEEACAEEEKLSSSEVRLGEAHASSEQEKEDRSSPAALSPIHVPLDVPSPPPLDLQEPIVASPTLNVNKDMPLSGSEEGEELEDKDKVEELPDLYLPSLILPAMFLPIPNVRSIFRFYSLTWWLRRHS